MSLLGSPLLSRFSRIVICGLVFFVLCLKTNYEWVHVIIVFLGLVYSLKMMYLAPSICLQNSRCYYFFCCVVSTPLCKCTTFSLSILLKCWGTFKLFPGSGYDTEWCYEHSWAHVIAAWLNIPWIQRGCGVKETLLHCWWECKLVQPFGCQCGSFSEN